MAVATWEDVATALGRPAASISTEKRAQITYWLNGIELLIINRLGPIESLDQATVKYVETEAVAEKARPTFESDGAESVTVAVDDGSVTRRYRRSAVSANDITDEWWDLLAPNATTSAFTINPFRRRGDCS